MGQKETRLYPYSNSLYEFQRNRIKKSEYLQNTTNILARFSKYKVCLNQKMW